MFVRSLPMKTRTKLARDVFDTFATKGLPCSPMQTAEHKMATPTVVFSEL